MGDVPSTFTPLIDVLVDDMGLISAAVYGRVWRYCQGDTGVCYASLKRIGEELDLSSRTILRHIKILCERGYLEDLTPGLRNRTHAYEDTGQARLLELTEQKLSTSTTESPADNDGFDTKSYQYDRESQQLDTESQCYDRESNQYDRESVEDTIKDTIEERSEDTIEESAPISMAGALPDSDQSNAPEGALTAAGQYIRSISASLGNGDAIESNLTRVDNIWQATGLDEGAILACMKHATDQLEKRRSRDPPIDKPMAYFFKVFEQEAQDRHRAAAHRRET